MLLTKSKPVAVGWSLVEVQATGGGASLLLWAGWELAGDSSLILRLVAGWSTGCWGVSSLAVDWLLVRVLAVGRSLAVKE